MNPFNYIKRQVRELFLVYCREFKLVLHDAGLILFFTFLPLAYPVVYSLIYNPEVVRDVKYIVVDNDRSAMSRELVRKIDACQGAQSIGYAANLGEARHAMDSHKCYGILEIPDGFEKAAGRGETANAVLYCEMSLMLRYKSLLMSATDVMMEMGSELQTRKIEEIAPLAATISTGDLLPIHNVTMGNIESGFDSFIMPGVIILILHQCIILASGMAGGARKESARLIGYDSFNSQPSVFMTMLGQMLCYFTLLIIPMIFLVHYVPLIFAFPMNTTVTEVFTFLLPMVIACLGLGFCFQGVVKERETVFVLWVVTSVLFLFLSGLTWPRYAMSGFWLFLSDCIPGTWGVEGFIRMETNGASLSQVRECYINLWILAGIYMALAYVVQRWVVRPQIRAIRGALPCMNHE